MRKLSVIMTALLLTGVLARAQTPPGGAQDESAGVRFTAVDVFVDAGDVPLGAYQIVIPEL